jgi:hypothetical protein
VTEAGRAANKLSAGGQLEALGDGLFGLLHGEKRSNTPERRSKAREKIPPNFSVQHS